MAHQKSWQIQWHVTADATVIRQRSKGASAGEQLYGRHSTTRSVDIADLDRMQERLPRVSAR